MQRIQMRKNSQTTRAVEHTAKRQRKKVLLAKERNWSAHVFDPLSAESATRQQQLVKECLS
jgi:hypothetical protein